jgi:hypothetical protein
MKITIITLAYHPGKQRLFRERKRFNVPYMNRRFGRICSALSRSCSSRTARMHRICRAA